MLLQCLNYIYIVQQCSSLWTSCPLHGDSLFFYFLSSPFFFLLLSSPNFLSSPFFFFVVHSAINCSTARGAKLFDWVSRQPPPYPIVALSRYSNPETKQIVAVEGCGWFFFVVFSIFLLLFVVELLTFFFFYYCFPLLLRAHTHTHTHTHTTHHRQRIKYYGWRDAIRPTLPLPPSKDQPQPSKADGVSITTKLGLVEVAHASYVHASEIREHCREGPHTSIVSDSQSRTMI